MQSRNDAEHVGNLWRVHGPSRSQSVRFRKAWVAYLAIVALVLSACQPLMAPPTNQTSAASQHSTVQKNIETARLFTEVVWNQGGLSRLPEFVADDAIYHTQTPGVSNNRDGMAAEVSMIHAGLSDIETTIHDIFGEDDLVVLRWSVRADHTGDFMGAAGTGQPVMVPGISLYRLADGKIVEEWSAVDMAGLLVQLGIMPPMGEPGQAQEAQAATTTAEATADTTPEQVAANKEIARRITEELWGEGQIALIEDFYADDARYHGAVTGGPPTVETIAQDVAAIHAALSNLQTSAETVVAAGDRVAVRWTTQATHSGDGLGLPATGRDIAVTGISIYHLAEGKIVTEWTQQDLLGLLSQLGAIPPTAVDDAAASNVNTVTFSAVDYTFVGPDSIPAGWTRIQLQNEGTELHHAQLLRLPDDKTMADLMQAMQEDPEHAPDWLAYAGGPGVIIPGEGTSAVVNLEPGNYVLICVLPDAEGISHAAHGMVRPLEVVEPETQTTTSATLPEADITMELFDFSFTLSEEIRPGRQTIRVVNHGPQAHEVAVIWLAPGASVQDFMAAFAPDAPEGPPPGKPLGGMQVIDSGAEGYFTVEFGPGEYALICFHPDNETGAPHFALGMVQQFTVR